MRLSWIASLTALASPILAKTVPGDDFSDGEPTKFNSVEVPPMKLLRGPSINETISKGYW